MQVDMSIVKLHDVIVGDKTHQVRTGMVPNGYWWKCQGFVCDGVQPTREAALESARKEIKARSLDDGGIHD